MINKFILFIYFSLCISQNFIYETEDWLFLKKPNIINSISEGPFDVFFGTPHGVYSYNFLDENIYYDYQLNRGFENNHDILCIHYDNFSDQIWFITRYYIYYKNPIFNYFNEIKIMYNDLNDIQKIGSTDKYLVIETNENKYLFDSFSGNELPYEESIISNDISWTSIYNYPDSVLDLSSFYTKDWIVGFNSIHDKYGGTEKVTVNHTDSENNLWIGTNNGRLLRGYRFSKKLDVIDIGPAFEKITSVERSQNGEWYLASAFFKINGIVNYFNYYSENRPFLSVWNESSNSWSYFNDADYAGIKNPDINYIYSIGQDYLALGTMNGLILLPLNSSNHHTIVDKSNGLDDSAIFKIQSYDDKLYLMTSETISIYSISSRIVTVRDLFNELNIGNSDVLDMMIKDNMLYFSTRSGMFQYNIDFKALKKISNLIFNEIFITDDFIYGSNDFIYQLNVNDFSESIILNFSARNFEISNNYIWLNYGESVKVINLETRNEWTYDHNDGLMDVEIFDIQSTENEILFLTNKGLIAYDWKKYHIE